MLFRSVLLAGGTAEQPASAPVAQDPGAGASRAASSPSLPPAAAPAVRVPGAATAPPAAASTVPPADPAAPRRTPPLSASPTTSQRTLPRTGPAALPALLGVVLLGAALALRRRTGAAAPRP